MAVQKSKKARSRRGMRRAHDHLAWSAASNDSTTGELCHRHHVSRQGFYKGVQVIQRPMKQKSDEAVDEPAE